MALNIGTEKRSFDQQILQLAKLLMTAVFDNRKCLTY